MSVLGLSICGVTGVYMGGACTSVGGPNIGGALIGTCRVPMGGTH